MRLLPVLFGLAFAVKIRGILEGSDTGEEEYDDGAFVLELPNEYPFFYELTGPDGGKFDEIMITQIEQENLVGMPVIIEGVVHKIEMTEEEYIEVTDIALDEDALESDLYGDYEAAVGAGVKTLGQVTAVVVMVTGKGAKPKRTSRDISDKVFGTHGDRLNLNIFDKCSYGKFKVVAFNGKVNGHTIRDGVIAIDVGYDPRGHDHAKVKKDVLKKIADKYGNDNMEGVDHTMLYMPKGVLKRGNTEWLAYAYVPGWLGVYNSDWMAATTTIAHELGHNLYLKHANENGQEYGDQSGIMGFGENNLDGPDSCFNGPNNWQLGWYEDRTAVYRSGDGRKVYKILGISDYKKTGKSDLVVLKVGRETYVSFNRKSGVNRQVREFPDKVLVHTWKGIGTASWMVKSLRNNGDSYTCTDGSNMKITLNMIDLSKTPAYAMVTVTSTGAKNTATWLPGQDMTGCRIEGKCIIIDHQRQREKCSIEAASDGELMFSGGFDLKGTQKYDVLYVGRKHVMMESDLPNSIRDGTMIGWSTRWVAYKTGFKICMSPRAKGEEDKCKTTKCRAPTTCEASVFCFGGECKATAKPAGADCNDGNARTVEDKCDAKGKCAGVDKCANVDCSAKSVCTGAGTCDINTGKCKYNNFAPRNTKCDDGEDHTMNDVCDGKGTCKGVVDPSKSLWRLKKSGKSCYAKGKCIGSGYKANEDCEWEVLMRGLPAFEGKFDIERGWDFLKIGSTNISPTTKLPVVAKNTKVTFTSDRSSQRAPWKLCLGDAPAPPKPGSMNEDQKVFSTKVLGKFSNVKVDCALSKIAQSHAELMRKTNKFSLTIPPAKNVVDQVSEAGSSANRFSYSAGSSNMDNLVSYFGSTLARSKGFGIGIARGGDYGTYVFLLANDRKDLPAAACMSGAELALAAPFEWPAPKQATLEIEEETQTFSSLTPSMLSSFQNILAAIGVLSLGYGAYQVFCKKGAYNPVTYQEEI